MRTFYIRCDLCRIVHAEIDVDKVEAFLIEHHRHTGVWATQLVDVEMPIVNLRNHLKIGLRG